MKFRTYDSKKAVPKPLVVGWVPSKVKLDLMMEGREKELPGYWLYNMQVKYLPGRIGKICGWLFGRIYANRRVERHDRSKRSDD